MIEEVVFYSCLFMLLLLGIYLFKIFKNMEEARTELHHSDFVPIHAMNSVYNPINITINSEKMSVKDGLVCTLSAQEPGFMLACWGTSISNIYATIYLSWRKLKLTFQDRDKASEVLKEMCLSMSNVSFGCCENEDIVLKPAKPPDLGDVPRDRYPLVLFVITESMTMNIQHSEDVNENCVVFHAIIFHIKDEVCPYESHIISHFVRCTEGVPCDLKQLYTSGNLSEPVPLSEHYSSTGTNTGFVSGVSLAQDPTVQDPNQACDICIVCQVNHVNKVFLPCRHTCVCDFCYEKVDKCPMCRGVIHSCFNLSQESNFSSDQEENTDVENKYWFDRLNDRLNRFFGFT